jgi:Flp pilus assembly protein TadD
VTAITPPIRQRAVALVAAAGCLLGAFYLGSSWQDEHALREANDAGRAGDYATAVERAREVSHAPTKARALRTEAYALLAMGDVPGAVDAFRRAAEAAPNDADVRRGWSEALRRAGRPAQADRQLSRAIALDPGVALPPGFVK